MQDLIETAIENIYTKLQEYVEQENLIEKEKCINGVKESRKITVNDLKPFLKLISKLYGVDRNNITTELAKKVDREIAHLFFTKQYMTQLNLKKINI